MRYICRECGNEIENGADFCYFCGGLKKNAIAIDDSGKVTGSAPVCPSCGKFNSEGDEFCAYCGSKLNGMSETGYAPIVPRKLNARDYVSLILGLVPGVMNLFGLGHLVQKKWSRGFMYLGISAIIIYVRWFTPGLSGFMLIMIEMLGLFLYLKQSYELFTIIYSPQDKKEGPKGGQ